MKKLFTILTLVLATSAQAEFTGFVTPAAWRFSVNKMSMIRHDNTRFVMHEGALEATFERASNDLIYVGLKKIDIPEGRYVGASLCFEAQPQVLLSGQNYQGQSVNGFSTGTGLFSSAVSAFAANALSTSAPAASGYLSAFQFFQDTCVDLYFTTSVCVRTGGASCKSFDRVIDPSVSMPHFTLFMDMQHSVGVDANQRSLTLTHSAFPVLLLGTPSVAINLHGQQGDNYGNITLILDSDKKLLHARSYGNLTTGFCAGSPGISVTGAVEGSYRNGFGPTAVSILNAFTGRVQFAAGNCTSLNTDCRSSGIVTLDSIYKEIGQTVTGNCVPDTAADPAFLNYTYTAGAGSSGSISWIVARIVDPNQVLGTCNSTKSGYQTGTNNQCSYFSGSGGYY